MEDSEDEIFWGPICEREREVVKSSLLRAISECSSRIPRAESTNEDCTSVISQSLGSEVSVESASISSVKSNTYLENNCIDTRSSTSSVKISVNDDGASEFGGVKVLERSSEQSVVEGTTLEDNLETLESEVFDPNGVNKLQPCVNSHECLMDSKGDSMNRNSDFISGSNIQHDLSITSSCSQRNETSNDNDSSESFVSPSLGSEISAGSHSIAISVLNADTFCNEENNCIDIASISCGGTFPVNNGQSNSVRLTSMSHINTSVELSCDGNVSNNGRVALEESRRAPTNFVAISGDSSSGSKYESKEVCDVSLCGMKLAALANGEAIDAATDSVLLECSSDGVDNSSESDCLNDTLEEVENMMKCALKFMHCGENTKANFLGDNKSSELQDHETKNLLGPNFEGVPHDLKPGTSQDSNYSVIQRSPEVNVGMKASPRKIAEKNASHKFKRTPRNLKLQPKKHNFSSIASPVAEYIKHGPPCLFQNVKVKKRDMLLHAVSDENVRLLTPAGNKQNLPVVEYDRAPVVNVNCPRFFDRNILPKPSGITRKIIKHTGRALLTRSPSRTTSNVCSEVSLVYEKNVSATNNLN